MGRLREETRPCRGWVGRSWSRALGKPLTPTLCLGVSTELRLQQDNQDSGPEEALGECPLPDLLGAGSRRWCAHPPDCVVGHVSPTKQQGQQCPTGPGCRCCLRAWGMTQLGLEKRPNSHTGRFWSSENPGVCSLLSHPSERGRAAAICASLLLPITPETGP